MGETINSIAATERIDRHRAPIGIETRLGMCSVGEEGLEPPTFRV
jgi:hypothetical protein